ncbi:zinc finger, CCHC-type containing LTR copia-type gag-polypeptide [Tanacetum coccineum]
MAAGDTVDSPLTLNTILHMLTIKLSSSNYLLWRNQVLPLLAYQKLTGYINGSISSPPPTIADAKSTAPKDNPAYLSWLASDQRALILLQSSLSEEAMAETLSHKTLVMYGVHWRRLIAMIQLNACTRYVTLSIIFRKDLLLLLSLVASLKQSAIRLLPLVILWMRPIKLTGSFVVSGLLLRLFLQPSVAFNTTTSSSSSRGRGNYNNRDGSSRGRGHGRGRDWYVDSGASAHMTPSSSNLDSASTYSGNELVLFGNRNASSISNVGTSILSPNIALLDVLVVPHLTKSLLSISKLTMDNPVDVLFSN